MWMPSSLYLHIFLLNKTCVSHYWLYIIEATNEGEEWWVITYSLLQNMEPNQWTLESLIELCMPLKWRPSFVNAMIGTTILSLTVLSIPILVVVLN